MVATGRHPGAEFDGLGRNSALSAAGGQYRASPANSMDNRFFPQAENGAAPVTVSTTNSEAPDERGTPQNHLGMLLFGRNMHGHSGPVAAQNLPGIPTVSGPLDPGPYNEANAMLRRQLPHYNVRIP
jgi:hypothetical protein